MCKADSSQFRTNKQPCYSWLWTSTSCSDYAMWHMQFLAMKLTLSAFSARLPPSAARSFVLKSAMLPPYRARVSLPNSQPSISKPFKIPENAFQNRILLPPPPGPPARISDILLESNFPVSCINASSSYNSRWLGTIIYPTYSFKGSFCNLFFLPGG